MHDITGKRIAILSTHGFERSELEVPRDRLTEAGAEVVIVAPKTGTIRGWDGDDWGGEAEATLALSDAKVEDFDALVLPGGQINPDLLRVENKAVQLVRGFFYAKKPIAAICHAPWLLIEAEVLKGRKATSYHSIRKDVENAGAHWLDEAVVCDEAIVTSRSPADLDAFCAKIAEEVAEGIHSDRAVAS
ncbi:MAG: type 1 glutamine amidotransferase domain-containing protein [Pseudomonadota bacterium]